LDANYFYSAPSWLTAFGRMSWLNAQLVCSHQFNWSDLFGLDLAQGGYTQKAHALLPSTRWETIMETSTNVVHHEPWNKGKIVGQKPPSR
jgi:hypothetical protein